MLTSQPPNAFMQYDTNHVPMPGRPAADYLAELRETGFTLLDNVVAADALSRIRSATLARVASMDPAPPDFDDRFGVPDAIAWSEDVCRAVTHPVALWLIREYLGTPDIHFCHQPAMTVLRPARDLIGSFPDSGWHSDYPYHHDVFPVDRWQDESIYGVQYNICIDEFRADNGATQYVPDSFRQRQFPPTALNEGGTRMGVPPHDKVVQMLAPAGAALIYDSRTWHRACPELNVSGADRLAILNAVCPAWVRPMSDKSPGSRTYFISDMDAKLGDRERNELRRLCHTETAEPPSIAPVIVPKPPVQRR